MVFGTIGLRRGLPMLKKLFITFLICLLPATAFCAWKFNPYTGKSDYYEVGGITAEVDGSITNELPIAGTYIDISGTPASTVAVDPTEMEAVTFGAGGNASNIWTFNLSGTDDTITFGSNLITFSSPITTVSTDGSNRIGFSNNTAIAPTASSDEIYFEANVLKANANGTEQIVAVTATAPATISAAGDIGVTVLKDIVTTAPLTGAANDVLPGADSDLTLAIDNISYTLLADGTDGNLITWDANGAPALVATGDAAQVLTSNGAGAAPTFQAAGAGVVLKDLVTTAPLTGGTNDILPGADADITIAIPQATTSVDGYVVQADWDSWTDHVADNTQAHSDYVINSGDTITGAITINDNGGTGSTLLTIGDANDADSVAIFGDLTVTGGDITLGTSAIFSGGDTTSLNLIDAIDATTETTLEAAIDTLGSFAEGGLADSTIVSADIKNGEIVTGDLSATAGITLAQTAMTAGRSLTIATNDVAADAELFTDFKGMTIETPTDADNFLAFEAPVALTVTRVTGIVEAATSAVLTWQECDSAGDNCSTIEAVTADVDGTISTTIDNDSIDAGDIVRLDVGTVTGTVGQAHSTITFTKND